MYNPTTQKILIVQSRGEKWGPPKGKFEEVDDNSHMNCALREVLEETGIALNESSLQEWVKIDRTTYFYTEIESEFVLDRIDDGISGITWIYPQCLLDLYTEKKVDLNYHCKRTIKKFNAL